MRGGAALEWLDDSHLNSSSLSGWSRNDFYEQVFEWIFLAGLCQNENNRALDDLDLWRKQG